MDETLERIEPGTIIYVPGGYDVGYIDEDKEKAAAEMMVRCGLMRPPEPPANRTHCGWCGDSWPVDEGDHCLRCTEYWRAVGAVAAAVAIVWAMMYAVSQL